MSSFFPLGHLFHERYRIEKQIGVGGMGIVYQATDERLSRSVALKILQPTLVSPEFVIRFEREAAILARLRSPHIVVVHDFGEEAGSLFIVTELLPDGDLQKWLAQHGPLERGDSLRLVARVCEGLADAHGKGVIHRDVKPGNVLLWKRKGELRPSLADFGIALDGNTPLTRSGSVIGSLHYIAPERHLGALADERGDVYSTGCLLWTVLTGTPPYTGTDYQIMNSHLVDPIPEIPETDGVSASINALLRQAMAKDPEGRAPSAEDLGRGIEQILRLEGERQPSAGSDGRRAAAGGASAVSGGTGEASSIDGTGSASAPSTAGDPRRPSPRPAQHESVHEQLTQAQVDRRVKPQPASGVPVPSEAPTQLVNAAAARPRVATGSARSLFRGSRPRARRDVLIGLFVVVALATPIAIAIGANQGAASKDSPAPRAVGESTAPALSAPPLPSLQTAPGYRSVRFTVKTEAADAPAGARYHAEVFEAGVWTASPRTFSVGTKEGGDSACARVRLVAVRDDEKRPGEPTKRCGVSAPRTVNLVRTDIPCQDVSKGPNCVYYDVVVAGFASGSNPRAFVYKPNGDFWCSSCSTTDFRRIHVGKDGRGRQHGLGSSPGEWQVPGGTGRVILDVDGVRQEVVIP